MIRNIIFDIGNVLTDFRWDGFLRDLGFDEAMVDRIGRASVLGPYWKELDRGVWSEKELIDSFVSRDPEIEEEIRRAFSDFTDMVTPRAYAIPWVKELKEKGFALYFLSNFSYRTEVQCAPALSFMPYMDGGILSYTVGLIKPDPEIYEILLERYELKAEESVFIDDTLANIETARALGIHGVHFVTKEQTCEELAALGV